MLQKMIRAIFRGVFTQMDANTNTTNERITQVDKKVDELKNQVTVDERRITNNFLSIQDMESKLTQTIDNLKSLYGVVDDKNLDSIREIADRIKSEVRGIEQLREDLRKVTVELTTKIENNTNTINKMFDHDWDSVVATIVSEEINKTSNNTVV
jgi:predicted  nucleic acid-binding Zn-ribbon protein